MSIFNEVRNWMKSAEQIKSDSFDAKLAAFQMGLQCEELAEKLVVLVDRMSALDVLGSNGEALSRLISNLNRVSLLFKAGEFNRITELAWENTSDAEKLLDGDLDLLWVTAGSIAALGVDGDDAWYEVSKANFAKFTAGKVLRNENGKVIKPPGWLPPDLTKLVR